MTLNILKLTELFFSLDQISFAFRASISETIQADNFLAVVWGECGGNNWRVWKLAKRQAGQNGKFRLVHL